MASVMRPSAIAILKLNTLTINKHDIHNSFYINRATLASGSESFTNNFQRLPVKEKTPRKLDANTQNNQRAIAKYTMNRIVFPEGSDNDPC